MKRKLAAFVLGLAVAMAAFVPTAQAVDGGRLTPLEERLLEVIEALEKRVSALEKNLAEEPGPKSESLGARVEALETQQDELSKKAESYGDPSTFRAYWKNGLRWDSNDGSFKLKLGGRIQQDWAWFDQDDSLRPFGDLDDGTEFRRVRLNVSGTIYDNVLYKTQYDFAGGDADFADVYVELHDIPVVGTLRIGQFYEPLTLEEVVSDNYITFLERSAVNDVFSPHRNTGVMLYNTAFDERMTWALAMFRDTNSYGDGADDGGYNWIVRVTGLPWYKDGGRKLLHLGIAYSTRNPDGAWRYRVRPEAHLSSIRFIDTGTFAADKVELLDLQAALVYGPLSLQGEYMRSDVDTRGLGDLEFDGYYVQASYFLTGEHRPYSRTAAGFSRVTPNRNFNLSADKRGWGAWEIGARYSTVDLDDGPIRGGEQDHFTLGLNWYLNPHARVMLNYVHANVDRRFLGPNTYLPVSRGGDVDIFQTRFQVDF